MWCIFVLSTDYNECSIDNGGCDHICINTIVGQKCECDEGYSLDSDGSSCIANAQCIDGVCECLDGFVNENSSGSGAINATTVNCVGKYLTCVYTYVIYLSSLHYILYCTSVYYSVYDDAYID